MIVSSRRPAVFLPTYRPVLTSMATSASVWLMTIEPPDFSHTLLRSALSSSAWTPYSSKIGYSLSYSFTRGDKRRHDAAR